MWKRKKMARNTLIIKDHVIRCVKASGGSLEHLELLEERYLPEGIIREGKIEDGETLEQIVQECVETWKLTRQPLQFCVPDAFIFIRKIDLPKEIKEADIGGYLFMELGESIPVPFSEPIFDYQYDNERNQVLVIAAPRREVEEYANLLEGAKCKPNAADISTLCLYRFLAFQQEIRRQAHTLLLQVDAHAFVVTIFHQDEPIFHSYVSSELSSGSWVVREGQLNWAESEEVLLAIIDRGTDEVERMMNFYQFSMQTQQEGIDHVLLCGDHPHLSLWEERLTAQLEAPVKRMSNSNVTMEDSLISVRFFENLGLVLKESVR
nr:pilus assembly protein PilM [Bacillus piscicola]